MKNVLKPMLKKIIVVLLFGTATTLHAQITDADKD
jgi:hypothetical protein